MIGALRGKLWRKGEDHAIVDCNGVGYSVALTAHTLEVLRIGDEVTLDIHTHVREDQIALFGFRDDFEKTVFELLLGVSGIGPKMAMTVLSGLAAPDLAQAIAQENLAVLTSISGVGKKTAERLLLGLKAPLKKLVPLAPAKASSGPKGKSGTAQELTSALVNLGYKPQQIEPVVSQVLAEMPEVTFEAGIRESLRYLRVPG